MNTLLFKVDSDALINYIKETRPVSKEYVDFVNSFKFFPLRKVKENKDFKQSWYNARYLQTARAYPIYLKLLDKYNAVDYNTIQIKALNFFKGKSLNSV